MRDDGRSISFAAIHWELDCSGPRRCWGSKQGEMLFLLLKLQGAASNLNGLASIGGGSMARSES